MSNDNEKTTWTAHGLVTHTVHRYFWDRYKAESLTGDIPQTWEEFRDRSRRRGMKVPVVKGDDIDMGPLPATWEQTRDAFLRAIGKLAYESDVEVHGNLSDAIPVRWDEFQREWEDTSFTLGAVLGETAEASAHAMSAMVGSLMDAMRPEDPDAS